MPRDSSVAARSSAVNLSSVEHEGQAMRTPWGMGVSVTGRISRGIGMSLRFAPCAAAVGAAMANTAASICVGERNMFLR